MINIYCPDQFLNFEYLSHQEEFIDLETKQNLFNEELKKKNQNTDNFWSVFGGNFPE